MPQDFYTLDQAAERLGIAPEKLVDMARRKELRAFMDRGTQRFRKQDIEELARRRGMGSDVELQLGDSSVESQPVAKAGSGTGKSADIFPFDISGQSGPEGTEVIPSLAGSSKSPPGSDSDVRLVPQGSDVELVTEQKAPAKPPSSKKITGKKGDSGTKLLSDSDSDVKLVEDEASIPIGREAKPASDSDVRLDSGDSGRARDSGVRLVEERPSGRKTLEPTSPTDEIDLDEELRRAEEASKSPRPKKAQSTFGLAPEVVSEKEGSSSDELALDLDSSSEVDIASGRDVTKAAETSGINLAAPSDRGVSLSDSSSEEEALSFELSDDSDTGTTPKPSKKEAPRETDSSSEFELTLDDEGLAPLEESRDPASGIKTDMVLPLQDEGSSDDMTLQPEGGSSSDISLETSDFELALDEEGVAGEGDTGSEVIVIDEEASDAEATVMKPEAIEDIEDVAEVTEAEEELTVEAAAEEEEEPVTVPAPVAVEAAAPEWGWWSIVHLPTALIMLFVGFLLFEMLRSIWSYNQPTAVGSKVFDMFSGMMK